jgi:hypothetical protein
LGLGGGKGSLGMGLGWFVNWLEVRRVTLVNFSLFDVFAGFVCFFLFLCCLTIRCRFTLLQLILLPDCDLGLLLEFCLILLDFLLLADLVLYSLRILDFVGV